MTLQKLKAQLMITAKSIKFLKKKPTVKKSNKIGMMFLVNSKDKTAKALIALLVITTVLKKL